MIRFFGSSAPGAGVGPFGQLSSLRVPARTAAAKLIMSFLLRPATSLGLMLSFGVDTSATEAVDAGTLAVADALVAVSLVVDAEGVGVPATSPLLTADLGASAAQAVRTRIERAPARE